MAVSEQIPYKEYTANGVTKIFPLEFDCTEQNHLIVLVNDLVPSIGSWSLDTVNDTVTFLLPPATGSKITIQRDTPLERERDYQTYDNSIRPIPINKDFDLIWWKLQELGVADWILGNRITALKKYVDDQDDELRSYLMEEIRKQGVALDQLEEYYNYLMKRLAEIAVSGGWDASFVVDGEENQKQINDKTIQFVKSISDLKAYKPRYVGQVVVSTSNIANQNTGGGEFVCIQSDVLVENLGTVFRSSVIGFEDYFWVRINFEAITPEMCGAAGTLQDSTDAIERFLNICGSGQKGVAKTGKVYKTSRTIISRYTTDVDIDFSNSSIRPFFNLIAGQSTQQTITLVSVNNVFLENTRVTIKGLYLDLTDFTPVVSTRAEDRRGIAGLRVGYAGIISISNYKCKNSFYGRGLHLSNYRHASLDNIQLPDCGMKITPTQDNTGVYDAAGDAVFLVDIIGHGTTTINNLTANGHAGSLGRIGVVMEQFLEQTLSHVVTLNNAHFEGYHRVIHQEDGGKARCVWNGGSAKRFSNLVYNLGGVANKNYFDAYDLSIEVDPPFDFGGTYGTTCFQGYGDTYYTNCDITYKKTVAERGNKFITGGNITIDNGVAVGGVVSTKTHTLTNVDLISNGGYLRFDAGNKGVTVNGGSLTGVSGSITRAIHSVNGAIKIGNNCKLVDASVSGENTSTENPLVLNRDKNTIADSEIVYTGNTNAVLFASSFQSAFKLANVNIRSKSAKLTLYGSSTRYSINSCEFVNVAIESVNATIANTNGICKLKNSELYYDDNYGQTSPFSVSAGTLTSVLSGNTLFDATTAQNIALPVESTTFKYTGAANIMVKKSGITVL